MAAMCRADSGDKMKMTAMLERETRRERRRQRERDETESREYCRERDARAGGGRAGGRARGARAFSIRSFCTRAGRVVRDTPDARDSIHNPGMLLTEKRYVTADSPGQCAGAARAARSRRLEGFTKPY